KMLREFGLRGRRDRDVGAKHDGARGRGALIDGQHKGHGDFLEVFSWVSRRCFPKDWLGRGKRIGAGSSISRRREETAVPSSLLPLWEKVAAEGCRMRGIYPRIRHPRRHTPHPSRTRFARPCHPLPQGERESKNH